MAKIKYTADAGSAIKAAKDLAKAQDEIAVGANKTASAFGKADKEVRRFIKAAEGPTERYNRKLAETADLLRRGKINQEQATQAVNEHRKRLDRVGESSKNAFALNGLAGYAAGVLSISSALGGVKRLLDAIQQLQEVSADRVRTSLSGFGELQQISKDEPTFQRRKNLANEVLGRGIAKDEGVATSIAFDLDSANLNKTDKELFLKIGENKFVKPEDLGPLALATNTAQIAIGKEETGGRRDLVNKALAAAENVKGNASEVLEGLAKFGTNLGALGFSDEAGFAALEITSQARGSVSEGATSVAAALKALEKSGIAKGTLAGTIKAINVRRDAGGKVRDILGTEDGEAITAIRLLGNNSDLLKEYTKDITKAQADDPLRTRIEFLNRDPVLGPALQAVKSAGGRRVAENENLSPTQNLITTIKNERATRLIKDGRVSTAILHDIGTSALDLFGRDRSILMDNVDNENLEIETRIKIAQRLKATVDEGIGPLASEGLLERANEKYDRMIELLEQQLGVSEKQTDLTPITVGPAE